MAHVTRDPIAADRLIAAVADAGRGGTALFLGTVRRGVEDGPVARIEYEAYVEMLEEEFGRILAEARERTPGVAIVGVHRIGAVPAGEASIGVAAGAGHRAEAFDACRWVVDQAKQRLPVWKREVLEDGTAGWREG